MKTAIQIGALVTVVGITATLAIVSEIDRSNREGNQQRFVRLAERIEAEFDHRVSQYNLAIRAVQGLFLCSENVECDEFETMIDSLAHEAYLPGFKRFGYAQLVQNDAPSLADFTQRLKEEGCLDVVDVRPLSIDSPLTVNQPRLLARMLSDQRTSHSMMGFDLAIRPEQLASLLSSQSADELVLLKGSLVSDQDALTDYSLVAVDRARDKSLPPKGILFFTFDASAFESLDQVANGELRFQLYESPRIIPAELVAASADKRLHAQPLGLNFRQELSIGDKHWILQSQPTSTFLHSNPVVGKVVLLSGTLITLLIATTILLLRHTASRAVHMAKAMTADLRRLAMVAERTTNAVVITDEHQNIIWVNQGFSKLTGYEAHEVLGKKPGKMLQFEQTCPDTVRDIHTAIVNKRGFCGEICNRSKSGRMYWVYLDIQPLFQDDGKHIGFLAIENDVTEMKVFTEELAKAKAETERALEGGKLAIWQWNLATQTMMLDHRFYEIAKHTPRYGPQDAEFWVSLVHHDDLERFQQTVTDCVSGVAPEFENEFRLMTEDGQYTWMLARGHSARCDENGNVYEMVGTIVEINDRKAAEFALRDSEAKASAVLNSSIDAILMLKDYRIVDCNRQAISMFGYDDKESLLGMHLQTLSADYQAGGKTTPEAVLDIEASFAETGYAQFEWTYIKRDGTPFEGEVSCSNIDDGGSQTSVAIIRDVSKRKEMERQLSQAQKLESIGQLAAGVAHEINTPMQCVFSNVEYLKEALTKIFHLTDTYRRLSKSCLGVPEVVAAVDAAEASCKYDRLRKNTIDAIDEATDGSNRVIEIVRAMKTMSHPGTLELVATDLNKLIRDASILARNRWKYVSQFSLELDESIETVEILPAQMSQVMLNLIVNSADAIVEKLGADPKVFGTITAKTYRSQGGIVIEVSDTGNGMPESVRRRVFDPFFTTKQVGKGTGQGLAIAYDVIVRQHRGQISVDSKVGTGTTFKIWLPDVKKEAARKSDQHAVPALNAATIDWIADAVTTST